MDEVKPNLKKERKKENKILKVVLLIIGIFFLAIIVSFFIMNSNNNPKYRGLTFNMIKEGELIFYQTSFPIIYNGEVADYNIYLRNNPEKLQREVKFKGEISSIDNAVINITQEFDCDGDQVIAIGNIVNLYGAIGKKLVRDENASCDESGRYTYIVIQPGEDTRVEQFGINCYNIDIEGCEILEGTERYIIELLSKYNSDIYEE